MIKKITNFQFIIIALSSFFIISLLVYAFDNPASSPPIGGGYLQTQSGQLLITKPAKVTAGNNFIVENGNVGIGTTGPTQPLDVNGNALVRGSYLTIGTSSLNTNNYLFVNGGGGSRFSVGTNGIVYVGDLSAATQLNVYGGAMLAITTGNVGIGTTTPTAKLEVAGQIKISGGNPGLGKVLTSDASGLASWQTISVSGVPSGYSILGETSTPPTGYTYIGPLSGGDIWLARAAMPTARYGLAAAAVNNKIYALGGYKAVTGYTATNEEYDPATNTWTTKAAMPTARYGLAAAAVNNKIYALGGYNASGYLATNQEYDPATNSWTTKAPMPTAREGLAAAAVNNKIYALGGHYYFTYIDPDTGIEYEVHQYYKTNEEYDPATNTWTTKAAMPTGRYGLAAAVLNNKIYALGGYNDVNGYLATNEEYDPVTNTWTTKASMPTARYFLAAAEVNNKIYALGGTAGGYLATNQEYNPVTNTWQTRAAMPTARAYLAAAAVNNKIYALGGTGASAYLATNEEYTPYFLFYIFRKD